jgi:hypothetical protein
MFTKNESISKEAVNVTTAMVHEIDCSTNSMVISITLQLIDTNIKLKLKRQTFQHGYLNVAYYYKASFSIVLAYAIINHNTQGATIASNILIDIQNAFFPRLIYVMLSRLIDQRNLKIRRTMSPINSIHFSS